MGIIACDGDESAELSPFAKLVIGVCAMEKKAFSPPMTEILNRLRAFGEFKICMLADKVILEEPIQKWSECDCLIAFYSFGYPLDKAEAYAALRKPYLINELKLQRLLQDRRRVYSRLEECNIPIPNYAVVNRDYPYQKVDYFVEDDDYIEIHGKRIWKPFVEKPVDGDNHRVMIYYPSSAGGGMKELFRKIGNRSSEFHPEVRKVRRDGSYIYEEFMPTGGTDVKVYTIGPNYAHAEARKSPVVDGVVTRNADGKELRYPVLLTPAEKEMAREVCVAFGQAICGFDLLRSQGRSYVCDVNGWSFVKNSYKYYDDAACILRKLFLDAKAPHMSSAVPSPLPWKCTEPAEGEIPQQGNSIPSGTFGQSEELRCVIAILRHGDRTLKQKVKLRVTHKRLLDLMLKYNGGKPRAEAKLKSAVQLQDLLDATRMLVPQSRLANENDSEAEDLEYAEKLRHVKAVLEEGGHFSGIYRKVQLKPTKWAKVFVKDGVEEEYPTETLMVLKYGGVLTHAGTKQAEELGRYFRNTMYPGEGTGLLRLHSTYRHDSKIYSSDEGRVQMSAAAFAKGLLDLEGPLTPILVSLVSKDSSMLDGLDTASIEMEQLKAELYDTMYSRKLTSEGHSEVPWMIDSDGLSENSSELLPLMVRLVKGITDQLKVLCKDEEEMIAQKTSDEAFPPYDQAKALGKTKMDVDRIAAGLPCGSEGFLLMFARWKKLERDIYNEWKGQYDITKISVVYGSSKYDLLHNAHLKLKGLGELYTVAKALATEVIPNEYGNNPHQRLKIGSKVARQLLGKVLIDLQNTREEAMNVAGIKHTTVKKGMHHSYLIPKSCKSSDEDSKPFSHREDVSRSGSSSEMPSPHAENKETQYHLDPLCVNLKTPERRVRTRLYFTSESHIHSLMNVIRYCHLDDTLQGEEGLISNDVFLRIFETRELDYLAHIVLRMYENVAVPFEDPRRFRIELLFSCGAALSPLEASPRHRDHTLPVTPAESLLEEGCFLSLERLDKMIRPFAMPAEDFRAVSCTPHLHGGLFAKP